MYEAKIIRHSVSKAGIELVSFEVNYPHAIHKDVMTHRWARNFKSFRAVPTEILLAEITKDPFRPEEFNARVKGMGRGEAIREQALANFIWDDHVGACIRRAKQMMDIPGGIAKEQVNFLIQDLCWIRGIITTTLPQLENFFGLRLELTDEGQPVARPEVFKIADMMAQAYHRSEPQKLPVGAWHLPYVSDDEIDGDWDYWKKVSVGRCARISYLTHDGIRDPEKDIALHDSLSQNGHMSPFEHQGTPVAEPWFDSVGCGSFGYGWKQYRKFIPGEANYLRRNEPHTDLDGSYVIN